MNCEPATTIISLFNGADGEPDGVKAVAKIIGAPPSRVRNWRREKGPNGTGGFIPSKYVQDLLAAATERGIDLQPGDFITALRLKTKAQADV